MKHLRLLALLFVASTFLTACHYVRQPACPAGYHWDAEKKVCIQNPQAKPEVQCPDQTIVDIDRAVNMSINCVKADPQKFDRIFAVLIDICKGNPSKDNAGKIQRFVQAVSVEAPYVRVKKAEMKYNRYFSPHKFSSAYYEMETIQAMCGKKQELLSQIDEELADKKVGMLECMAAPDWYKISEQTAVSLKTGINATCKACCESGRGIMR